jgi:hypothetical protein
LASVIVTLVLLKVARIWQMPVVMFFEPLARRTFTSPSSSPRSSLAVISLRSGAAASAGAAAAAATSGAAAASAAGAFGFLALGVLGLLRLIVK